MFTETPGPRPDPIRPPAATFWKTKHTNEKPNRTTTKTPAYSEVSPLPYFASLFPVLTKSSPSLSLSLTDYPLQNCPSPWGFITVSFFTVKIFWGRDKHFFSRVGPVPSLCLSQTTKYGSSINITIRLYKHLLPWFSLKKKKTTFQSRLVPSSLLSTDLNSPLSQVSAHRMGEGRKQVLFPCGICHTSSPLSVLCCVCFLLAYRGGVHLILSAFIVPIFIPSSVETFSDILLGTVC